MTGQISRRGLIQACGKTALAAAAAEVVPSVALAHLLETPTRARLVDADGAPIKASDLKPHDTLLFNYPFTATPVMLVALEDAPAADGVMTTDAEKHSVAWPGGTGPDNNLVAYAAICAHSLSFTGHETSFVNYSAGKNSYGFEKSISCCAHGSVYDPSQGAKVVNGPAQYNLASIVLEHNPNDDSLTAVDAIGTEIYAKFYKSFRKKLRNEYGRKTYRSQVEGDILALSAAAYSKDVLHC